MGGRRIRRGYGGRLPSAFLVALGIHAAAALALLALVLPRPPGVLVVPRAPPEELVVVSEEPAALVPSPAPVPEAPAPDHDSLEGSRLESKRAAAVNAAPDRTPDSIENPEPQPRSLAPRADPSAHPSAPTSPVDLGIGGYWKQVAMAPGEPETTPEAPPQVAPPRSPSRVLLDVLEAEDHERGLGRGGPLVSAAHEAASLPIAPDIGAATLEIEADGEGRVIAANVASSSTDPSAWRDVARELVKLMASKRLQMPRGTHGYRAVLRITAERKLPAGEKREVSPGAVPEGACIGEGISRKCPEHGLPLGVSGTWGDLSNFGQRPVHMVHARVLDERTF